MIAIEKIKSIAKSNWLDGFAILALIACGIKLVYQIPQFLDIIPTDDSHYMQFGFRLPNKIYRDFGPIYSAWFKLLKVVLREPFVIYFTSFMIITCATPIALFVFLRGLKMERIIAFMLALFFLCSDINLCFNAWPKISHFTIFFVFLVAWASNYVHRTTTKLILATIFIFVSAYIRPEYMLSFGMLTFLTFGWIIAKEKFKISNVEKGLLVLSIFIFVFFYFMPGLPLSDERRTALAFQQHFAWNYQHWFNLPDANWFNYRETTAKYFGDASSIVGFLKANPEWFFKHVFFNISNYFILIYEKIGSIFLSKPIFGLPFWTGWLLFIVVLMYKIITISFKIYLQQVLSFFTKHLTLFFILCAITIPSLISSIIIYPREHYLVLQFPMFFFLLTALFSPKKSDQNNSNPYAKFVSIALFIGVFFIVPKLSGYTYINIWEKYNKQYCYNAMKQIRTFNIKEKVVLLESEGGFDIYSGRNYTSTPGFFKDKPFYTYLNSMHINMIYVSKILTEDKKFFEDPEWVDFEKNYAAKGYDKIPVEANGPGYYFYVKKGLIKEK